MDKINMGSYNKQSYRFSGAKNTWVDIYHRKNVVWDHSTNEMMTMVGGYKICIRGCGATVVGIREEPDQHTSDESTVLRSITNMVLVYG